MKFYPYKKSGLFVSNAEGEGGTSFQVVLTQKLEVLAIVMGGCKKCHPLKGGGAKRFALS